MSLGQKITYLIELDHVWVTDFLKNFDLASDALNILLIIDLLLLKDFDGNL